MDTSNIIVKTNEHWDNQTPFVTMLVPVYNRRSTLRRALDSIEVQLYRDFEVRVRCVDERSVEIGECFPTGINEMP